MRYTKTYTNYRCHKCLPKQMKSHQISNPHHPRYSMMIFGDFYNDTGGGNEYIIFLHRAIILAVLVAVSSNCLPYLFDRILPKNKKPYKLTYFFVLGTIE